MERAGLKPGTYNGESKRGHSQDWLCHKKKSLAGSEAQYYTKELYRSSNGFVKQKMWSFQPCNGQIRKGWSLKTSKAQSSRL
jgi:hypothetical protein